MDSPSIADLPCPPATRTGWPWTEESPQLPDAMPDGRPWPRISIVTPSYNQGQFIEETIRSVLLQGYPNLEYIIIDGGSTDDSVEIIRKYEPWLAYWVSEKDRGQTDAIRKGFDLCTGDLMAYINSDDLYMPYTLTLVARLFVQHPTVEWLTGFSTFLVDGCVIAPRAKHCYAYNRRLFRLGFHTPWFLGIPQQVSTFWRSALYSRAGGRMSTELEHAMDVDLWVRMSEFSAPVFVNASLAMMRIHAAQKSVVLKSAFSEIESGRHPFWPLSRRRLFWRLMHIAGVRGVLRRSLLPSDASCLHWNIHTQEWQLVQRHAY